MEWQMLSVLAQALGALAAITRLWEFIASRAFKKKSFVDTW
jgi:hypothetical protein